jgi:hypothetical protein
MEPVNRLFAGSTASHRLYVASSWRNVYQPELVSILREVGHEVYDFRNPGIGESGFAWSDIDPDWTRWTGAQFREALGHPIAEGGFNNDFRGMIWAKGCVLLLPSGRSAHIEAGWFTGRGLPVWVLTRDDQEPELMYKLTEAAGGGVATTLDELLAMLKWERYPSGDWRHPDGSKVERLESGVWALFSPFIDGAGGENLSQWRTARAAMDDHVEG